MIKNYEILVIAKNTSGIVVRIMSLFNRRGYYVKKMTAGITNRPDYTRLTLSVEGDDEILDQIQKQVYKIVDVVKVKIFPENGVIRREMMLIKVKANEEIRPQIIQIAEIYRGSILDISPNSLTIEITGNVEKLQGFVGMMEKFTILEIARTGILAMSRGEKL